MVSKDNWVVISACVAIIIAVVVMVSIWPTPAQICALNADDIGLKGWKDQYHGEWHTDGGVENETSEFGYGLNGPTPDGYLYVQNIVRLFNSASAAQYWYPWLNNEGYPRTSLNSSLWDEGQLSVNPYPEGIIVFVVGNAIVDIGVYFSCNATVADHSVLLYWTERIAELQAAKLITTGVVHY